MGKLYLQEKINPDPGKYIIVGKDGFLTTGDIPIEAYPQIMITTDPGRDVTEFSAYCNNQRRYPEIVKINDHTFACTCSEFGSWRIVINERVEDEEDSEPEEEEEDTDPWDDTLSEFISIEEIRIYYMTLTIATSGGGGGGGGSAKLDKYTWQQIREIINQGNASSIFAIGDAKKITFKDDAVFGTVQLGTQNGAPAFETYAYIIGIDHNASIEGQGITFQIGYVNSTNKNTIAFVDDYYNTQQGTNDNAYFHMNASAWGWGYGQNNAMPWYVDSSTYCAMYELLNNNNSTSLLTCLPDELVDNMTAKPIYTDNGYTAPGLSWIIYYTPFSKSSVTVSKSKLFLLSECEIRGKDAANLLSSSYERDLQEQYAFYKTSQNPNATAVKYKHNLSTDPAIYWTRSRIYNSDSAPFCAIDTSGNTASINSLYCEGVAPAFCISNNQYTSTNMYITNPGSTSTNSSSYTSFVRINKTDNTYTDVYTSGKVQIDSNVRNLVFYGKTGYRTVSTSSGDITYTTKVGVKLNGTATGSVTGTRYYDYTGFTSLHTLSDLSNKGIIQISLVNGTASSGTKYIEITMNDTGVSS